MTITTGQATVTTSATPIIPIWGRYEATIQNHSSTVDVWIGDATVTVGTGFRLPAVLPAGGSSWTMTGPSAVYGITSAGSALVSFNEVY
jgi:hypothetical protein